MNTQITTGVAIGTEVASKTSGWMGESVGAAKRNDNGQKILSTSAAPKIP
jgi:hypothetical protein